MKKSPLGKAIEGSTSAVQEAFGKARDTSGISRDDEVNRYNQLKPEHFEALVEKHGLENVIQYIKEMESRRMKDAN